MPCAKGCCPDQLSHYRSISIAASACPSRSAGRYAASLNAKEKKWEKDFAAVKQMKKEGIVPKTTEGAADMLAKATSRFEIERGKILTPAQKQQYEALTETEIR